MNFHFNQALGFILTICIGFSGVCSISISEQLFYLGALIDNSDSCTALQSSQFADACRVPDVFESTFSVGGDLLSANLLCEGDCRCVMGARAGGACANSSVDGLFYCKCDYESAATTPTLSINCGALFNIALSSCGTNTIPFLSQFVNDYLCNADCKCSHGYTLDSTKNKCTTNNGVSGNTGTYCVCGDHINAF